MAVVQLALHVLSGRKERDFTIPELFFFLSRILHVELVEYSSTKMTNVELTL